jgi:hypothetical protein
MRSTPVPVPEPRSKRFDDVSVRRRKDDRVVLGRLDDGTVGCHTPRTGSSWGADRCHGCGFYHVNDLADLWVY